MVKDDYKLLYEKVIEIITKIGFVCTQDKELGHLQTEFAYQKYRIHLVSVKTNYNSTLELSVFGENYELELCILYTNTNDLIFSSLLSNYDKLKSKLKEIFPHAFRKDIINKLLEEDE